MEIGEARPDEFAVLADITVAAFRSVDPDLGDYGTALRDVAGRAAAAVVLVARNPAAPVGTVTHVPDHTSPWAEGLLPGEAGMRMLAVDPAARGLGAGRALVEECIARARADGRTRLFLHSTPAMTAAHRLYETRGFERCPGRDWPLSGRLVLLAYTLDL